MKEPSRRDRPAAVVKGKGHGGDDPDRQRPQLRRTSRTSAGRPQRPWEAGRAPAPGPRSPHPGTRTPVPGTGGAGDWVVGFHAVLALLEHDPSRVEAILVGESGGGGRFHRVRDLAQRCGAPWRRVDRRRLDEIAAGVAHNGFAARVAPTPLADAGSLLDRDGRACLLALDDVTDGHNLGAVLRVAAAFALDGVIIAGPHPPPLGGAAAKVAAGALGRVPIAHVGSLGDFARAAQGAGFWVLGAASEGSPVGGLDLPDRLLLCLGSESKGLRAKTRTALDGVVAIPLASGVESLNLAVAAGILVFEWRRRFPLPSAQGTGDRGQGTGHRE